PSRNLSLGEVWAGLRPPSFVRAIARLSSCLEEFPKLDPFFGLIKLSESGRPSSKIQLRRKKPVNLRSVHRQRRSSSIRLPPLRNGSRARWHSQPQLPGRLGLPNVTPELHLTPGSRCSFRASRRFRAFPKPRPRSSSFHCDQTNACSTRTMPTTSSF